MCINFVVPYIRKVLRHENCYEFHELESFVKNWSRKSLIDHLKGVVCLYVTCQSLALAIYKLFQESRYCSS